MQTAPWVMHCGLRVKQTLSDNREVWSYKGIMPGSNSMSHIRCCAKGDDVKWQNKEPARYYNHTTGSLQVRNNGFFLSVVSEDGGGTRGKRSDLSSQRRVYHSSWSCTTYFNYTRKREMIWSHSAKTTCPPPQLWMWPAVKQDFNYWSPP